MNIRNPEYPFCSLDAGTLRPEAAFFVIFGATGDLAKRKIFPSLFDLHVEGTLPDRLLMLGFARRDLGHESFRAELREGCGKYSRHGGFSDAEWKAFSRRIFYLPSDIADPKGYEGLAAVLGGEERLPGLGEGFEPPKNALFYLAVGPEYFGPIADRLGAAGLGSGRRYPGGRKGQKAKEGWRRLVVEKPYGRDGESAAALTESLQRNFAEKDIYRIDHYLGKETVQNLLYLRFANAIFEPIWNRNHIESIEISVFETEGIGQRGGYYDTAGAARDMLQNHLVQLMCLATMEPPASLDPESVRNEKVKVLQSIAPYDGPELLKRSVRGQYDDYLQAPKVDPTSFTETYVSLTLELDNWRFSGVPITLHTGKGFAEKFSQIVINFRRPPTALFAAQCGESLLPNRLVLRIQPDEGVWLRFNAKVSGISAIKASDLRFSFRDVAEYLPEAYERLIADALSGDSTLFIRADESKHAWKIVDALRAAWQGADPDAKPDQGGLLRYPMGSPIPNV